MIRVAHAILGYHPQIGGAENQARLLVKHLKENVDQIDVFTRNYETTEDPIDDAGISVHRYWKAHGFGSKEISALCIAFGLFRARKKFDIFHVHQCNVLAYFVALVGSLTKKPVIIKVANSGLKFDFYTMKKRRFGSYMLKYILRSNARFIALSESIAKQLEQNGVSKSSIDIIPNGVKISPHANLKYTDPSIGFVGRLEEVKRPFILIDLAKHFPKIQFHIFGDGSIKNCLKEKVASIGIKNVIFHGEISNIDIIYNQLNLIVLPSLAEGMSNTLLEAVVRGIRCLVTDLPENRALFKECQSIVRYVNSDKEVNWRTSLNDLLTLSSENIGKDSAILKDYYNIESVALSYVELYKCLINKPNKY